MGRRNLSDRTTFEVVGFYGPGDNRARVRLFAPWDAVPEEWRKFDRCGDREAWTEVTIDPEGRVYVYGGAVWPGAFPVHFDSHPQTTQGHWTTARGELLAAVFGPDPDSDDLRCAYCGRRWPCPEAGGSHTSLGELRARNRAAEKKLAEIAREVMPKPPRGLTVEEQEFSGEVEAIARHGGRTVSFRDNEIVEPVTVRFWRTRYAVEVHLVRNDRSRIEMRFPLAYAADIVRALTTLEEE